MLVTPMRLGRRLGLGLLLFVTLVAGGCMGLSPMAPPPAETVVEGVIRYPDGSGVPGATITLALDPEYSVVTDAEGSYRISHIALQAPAVVTWSVAMDGTPLRQQRIVLRPGRREAVHYTLESATGSVNGRVALYRPEPNYSFSTARQQPRAAAMPRTGEILPFAAHEPNELILRLDPVATQILTEIIDVVGGRLKYQIGRLDAFLVELPSWISVDEAIHLAERLPGVLSAQPNRVLTAHAPVPNDPRYTEQWHLPAASLPGAWTIERGSEEVIVAVLDTGYSDHPDLPQGARLHAAHSVFPGDTDYRDSSHYSHGVHVAGTLAAVTGNARGVAGTVWEGVRLMPIRVMRTDAWGRMTGSEAGLARGIDWAVANGAHVINLSLGLGDNDESPVISDAIEAAVEAGVTVVASAGNRGHLSQLTAPASHPNVISVGSIGPSGRVSYFSSRGNQAEDLELDIVAPGEQILSTVSHQNTAHGYAAMSGTSMSAPQVSGVIALLYSQGTLSKEMGIEAHELARRILRETAFPLPDGAGYDDAWGHGLLNAHAALTWLDPALIPQTQVFAGELNGDVVSVLGYVQIPDLDGEFTLYDVPAGVVSLFAWLDLDQSGHIGPGDYFAQVDGVDVADGALAEDVLLELRPAEATYHLVP